MATAELRLPAGTYALLAIVDDGIRIFIDGTKMMDTNLWCQDQATSNYIDVQLEEGEHSFRVELSGETDDSNTGTGSYSRDRLYASTSCVELVL